MGPKVGTSLPLEAPYVCWGGGIGGGWCPLRLRKVSEESSTDKR